MKKITFLFLMVIVSFTASAQLFVENFESATVGGNLEGYNDWKVSPKSSDNLGTSPKIGAGSLTYSGYISSGVGNVAILDSTNGSTSATQRISTHFATYGTDTMKVATAGEKVYVAFLVKFSLESKLNTTRDFFTFETSKTSTNNRGRLFAKIKSNGKFVLAISKNSTSVLTESTDSLNVSDTHLIVMVYENVEGTDNDKVYAYYDPDLTKSEAEQTKKIANVSTEAATDYSVTSGIGFNLRQRGLGAQIGGIRAAKSWEMVTLVSAIKNIETANMKVSGKSIYTDNAGEICIYNLSGKEVLKAKTNGKYDTQLEKGLYLVNFVGNDGKSATLKAIID